MQEDERQAGRAGRPEREARGGRSRAAVAEAAAGGGARATILASLDEARLAQKLEKERRLIEQAQQEKEEFDRILRVQREAEEGTSLER